MSTHHSFDVEDAKEFGVPEAVIINNFKYWITLNRANRKHQHDGRTWTYNSRKALCEVFPYFSAPQIRRLIDRLVELNVLVTGNYNKMPMDQTKWYAFGDEARFLDGKNQQLAVPNNATSRMTKSANGIDEIGKCDLTKSANGIDEIGRPIPDINTNINTVVTISKEIGASAPVSEKKRFQPKLHLLSKGVSEQTADDWLSLRKQKKAAVTLTAMSRIEREADKAGMSIEDVLSLCCLRGWTGFNSAWVAVNAVQANGGTPRVRTAEQKTPWATESNPYFDPRNEGTWGKDKWGNYHPGRFLSDKQRAFFINSGRNPDGSERDGAGFGYVEVVS